MSDPTVDLDAAQIQQALRDPEYHIDLILHPGPEPSALGSILASVAESIIRAVGQGVTLTYGDGGGLPARPGLSLSAQDHGVIHYLAAPSGPEKAPFLDALHRLAHAAPRPGMEGEANPSGIGRPAEALVFIASTCPHCPRAVRAANELAAANPLVTATIVDAQLFPELAERFCARSVPMTILDGRLSITGVTEAAALAENLVARGTQEYEIRVFRTLVEANRLEEAAEQVRTPQGLLCFVSVWCESTTSLRMGLLLTAETVLEGFPSSMDDAVSDLLPVLRSEDAALRGDTADLLGRIGHLAAKPALAALLDDPIKDVAEIAAEALEELGRPA